MIDATGILFADDHSPAYPYAWDYFDPGIDADALKQGASITLEADFTWNGAGTVSAGEHAILALTQRKSGDAAHDLFDIGVGGLVGDAGLAVELWDGGGKATVWDAVHHSRQAVSVPDGEVLGMQLCSEPQPGTSYITSAAGNTFRLVMGGWYRLRLLLNGEIRPGWTALRMELLQERGGPSPLLIQRSRIDFITDQYFPRDMPIEAAAARTGGTVPGNYVPVDYKLHTELLAMA